MKILLTGAFGNVGRAVQREAAGRGHTIICFDQPTKDNRRHAKRLGASVVWGDIRRADDVSGAMLGIDVVVHLAAVIPPGSVRDPELARQVNVVGTEHVIAAARAQSSPPKIAFASSVALFGPSQHLEPPRTLADPINATDDYTRHKAACETMLRDSGLAVVMLRLNAVIPVEVLGVIDPFMFEVPLDDRVEFVHPRDVATAFLNAIVRDDVWGRTFLIGGGPRCHLRERDIVQGPLEALGIGALPDEAFGTTPFQLDWSDTVESQALLQYQRFTFDDCIQHMLDELGWKRRLVRLARPLARRRLLAASPYYASAKRR